MEKAVKMLGIVTLLALTILAIANTALALPVTISRVEVNDVQVQRDATNLIAFERDNELVVDVLLSSTTDIKNVELEAFVSGYEYNDESTLTKSTSLFDMDANVSYKKTLRFTLPSDMDQDNYKLRILLTDRNGQETIQNYNLKVEGARHTIKIMEVTMSDDAVKSGSALLATVRIENQGQKTESDVKISVSVPDLGISATDYIDEIKVDKQKDSEELYLRIPTCAKPGIYPIKATVSYDREHTTVTKTVPFEVLDVESCKPTVQDNSATVVVTPPAQPAPAEEPATGTSVVKTALEAILLVLIGLLVVIGIILGLSRLRSDEDDAA